jgi:hypothetical protein
MGNGLRLSKNIWGLSLPSGMGMVRKAVFSLKLTHPTQALAVGCECYWLLVVGCWLFVFFTNNQQLQTKNADFG